MNDLIREVREAIRAASVDGSPLNDADYLIMNNCNDLLLQLCDEYEAERAAHNAHATELADAREKIEAQAKEIERLNERLNHFIRSADDARKHCWEKNAENAELRAEIERLKGECDMWAKGNSYSRQHLAAAVEVLEYYADVRTYCTIYDEDEGFVPAHDNGERATQALSHIKGGEPNETI